MGYNTTKMNRPLKIITGAAIMAGIAAAYLVRSRADELWHRNASIVEEQARQLSQMAAENQRLAAQLLQARTHSTAPVEPAEELSKLRARAAALQQETDELSKRVQAERRLAGKRFYAQGDTNLRGHYHEIDATLGGGPRTTGKLNDARVLTHGLLEYAAAHNGEFPQNLDLITKYFPAPLTAESEFWANAPLSGTNQFEIVYQGTQSEITNIPAGRIALIRETIPWQTPDGKWARTYGFANGGAAIVAADDTFQGWDAQYVVPAPEAGQ